MITIRSLKTRVEITPTKETNLHLEHISTRSPEVAEKFEVHFVLSGKEPRNGQLLANETRWVYPGQNVQAWDKHAKEMLVLRQKLSQIPRAENVSAEYFTEAHSGLVLGYHEEPKDDRCYIFLRFIDASGTREIRTNLDALHAIHSFILTRLGDA